MQVDTAVIVVGAGPTGLMLAGELALAGVAIEVVERELTPGGQSRGGGVNSRTAEVLAMRGLIDAATDRAAPRTNVGGHFAGLPVALDTRPWRTRYPGGLVMPQERLEGMLEDHLASFGVTVRRGTELTGLDTVDGAGVTATACGPGGQYRLRGRYLVACDGGHSIVRKLTGVAFPGRTGTMAAVSADIELTALSATVPRTADHISRLTRKGGGYWMLLHPVAGPEENSGVYRVVFGGPEQATLPRTAPVTADEVARALIAVHGPQTRLGRLRGASRFSDACRQVSDYRVGGVLFAGDAAHIHSPIGGQGLNLGVQDAVNLGWKLAAHVRGDAPEGLLDSYHTERHPVAARETAEVKGTASPARRALAERLPPDVAAAAVELITGPLLDNPHRVGKPLGEELTGIYSARLARNWRVRYEIDDTKHVVIVLNIRHRAAAYPAPNHRPLIKNGGGSSLAASCGGGLGDGVLMAAGGVSSQVPGVSQSLGGMSNGGAGPGSAHGDAGSCERAHRSCALPQRPQSTISFTGVRSPHRCPGELPRGGTLR